MLNKICRTRNSILCVVLWMMLFPLSLSAQLQLPDGPIRFLALGDSYTIGQSVAMQARWPEQLADSLAVRGLATDALRIIATTGWRTDNLINAVKNQNLQTGQYNLVSLLIGVNNQYQNRPFSQYITEFPALLDSAIRYAGGDKSKVFIVSIPDYAYTPFGQQSQNPNEISQELDQYNEFSKHIADSLHITWFDITPISRLGIAQPSLVAADGLHPSGLLYTEWVKLMLDFIDQPVTGAEWIAKDAKLKVTLGPNPSRGYVHVGIEESVAEHGCFVRVYNQEGNLMMEYQASESHFGFSIGHLPDGFYVLEIRSGLRQNTIKIVKRTS